MSSEEKITVIIDSSQLTDWDLCHYKYKLRYKDFIVPIRKEKSLDQGTLLHELLRVYYSLKRSPLEHGKIVQSCLKRGRMFVLKDCDLSAEDIAFVFKMFEEYTDFYRNENWIPLYVEKSFAVKAYEDDHIIVIVQGKVDLVIRIPGLPDPIIVDHKKRTRLRSESSLDHQKILYSKFLGMDTFIVNKILFQKTTPVEHRLRRETISYDSEQIEEWFTEFISTIKEMIAYDRINFYKRNPTSCDKWAGCAMKPWCNSPASKRASLLGQIYKIGSEWDVSKHLQEEE